MIEDFAVVKFRMMCSILFLTIFLIKATNDNSKTDFLFKNFLRLKCGFLKPYFSPKTQYGKGIKEYLYINIT